MANRRIEGTFHMEGLLEGPLFSGDDEAVINTFVEQARNAGLKFHAAISAGRFSLLADSEPVGIGASGAPADARIKKCLREFLKNYSPEECMQLMSTLRSVEYIPGHEVQTVYYIKPDCTASLEQRVVKADTIGPIKPVELKQKLKLIVVLAVVLCAGIGISAFFIPYKDMARNLISEIMPFDIESLKIDTSAFEKFFQVDSLEVDESKDVINIICEVSESYPLTEQDLNELWKSSGDSLSGRLTIEALARNSVRCIFSDSEGNFIGQSTCYMQWVGEDKKTFGIVVPFNNDLRLVQITY